MNKDKTLEELFLAQKPHFDDSEDFMASLNKRLDAVEYIKQHEVATIRRYKLAMVLAFVAGIISGGVAIAFMFSMPADVPLFTFKAHTAVLTWFSENSRFIVTTALSLLMGFGAISIVSNLLDILNIRKRMIDMTA